MSTNCIATQITVIKCSPCAAALCNTWPATFVVRTRLLHL
jgi:hypothetical protein